MAPLVAMMKLSCPPCRLKWKCCPPDPPLGFKYDQSLNTHLRISNPSVWRLYNYILIFYEYIKKNCPETRMTTNWSMSQGCIWHIHISTCVETLFPALWDKYLIILFFQILSYVDFWTPHFVVLYLLYFWSYFPWDKTSSYTGIFAFPRESYLVGNCKSVSLCVVGNHTILSTLPLSNHK